MMRIIPFVLCAILVVTTAAPNPGSYSSRHYQFQRSSSSYRNNELQHKDDEAGAYGRIEDPDKYDKPLEQSHYRQTSYRAPGADEDNSEDEYPSQTLGIKGGRPNSFTGHGHSANYHRGSGYYGQGVIDSDYTTGDSYFQPGRRLPQLHPAGFNYPPGNHYGHHQHRGYHHGHGHGYHHHNHQHEETSSQSSSSSVSTTNNKDDQLISLDQTFDYSKFKDQGFGKEYLENTEGERATTPRSVVSTTENIRPVFEITEAVPEQPEFSSQMGNGGRTIQQNQNREQQGQSTTTVFGQNSQQGQNIDLSIFGQNSQQGQTTTAQVFNEDQSTTGQFGFVSQLGKDQNTQQQIDVGQSFQQGQTTNGQNSQQGQVFHEDQSTTGQFAYGSQMGQDQDTQQQFDIGQSFMQNNGQNSQQGQVFHEDQSTTGQFGFGSQMGKDQDTQQQVDIGQSFMLNNGQSSQQGQVFHEDQSTTGQFGSGSEMGKDQDTQQQFDIGQSFMQSNGQNSQQGQVFHEDQSTTGQFGSGSQLGKDQDTQQQVDIGQSFMQGQTFQQGSQTRPEHLKPLFEQIDKIASMDHTNYGSGRNYESHHTYNSGRNYNAGHHREIMHHTTGYIKPKYETDFTHQHAGIDEPDCEHNVHETQQTNIDLGKMEFGSHHKEEEAEETTTQENIQEVTTKESQQEVTTRASQQENNNMEMNNQERQEEMSQGNLETMTESENEETTVDYYHQKHEKDYDQEEDLTQQIHNYDQQSNDKNWNGDFQQHQDVFGKFDYDGQHQEDLTQQTQDAFGKINSKEDLTQQQQNGWTQLGEDLTQKHDDEYGHLEFGGQQQEVLSQKNEDYGSNGYRNSYGYSTASSRSYSSSSSSRTSSSYGTSYNIQAADHQTADLTQNKEQEQFATEIQDVSQQVQKVENINLEAQKETPFEPEEIAVVVEEKPTEKPGFWKRIGGSISRTYESAKEKVKNNLG